MTDKTMTLEQVRDGLQGMQCYPNSMFAKWADAITRHLSQPAERGEAVARVRISESGSIGISPLPGASRKLSHGQNLYTDPPPAAGVPDDLLRLITLWRRVEDSNEEETEFDKGYEQASNECADSLEAALSATPSPTIDVAAVREVIAEHRREASMLSHDSESRDYLLEQADKLAAAIGDK